MATSHSLKALTADQIEKGLKASSLSPQPIHSIGLIVDESSLDYRPIVVDDLLADEPLEASYSGDSENDDQPSTPDETPSPFVDLTGLSSSNEKTRTSLNRTVVGGAVMENVCLLIPDEEATSFAGLPVIPIKGSPHVQSQILATVPEDKTQGKSNQFPVLLLPEEDKLSDAAASLVTKAQPLADARMLTSLIESTPKINQDAISADGVKAVVQTPLDNYALSGEIKNFFGIKGLKAKLYKYKGKESVPYREIGTDCSCSQGLERRLTAKTQMGMMESLPVKKSD